MWFEGGVKVVWGLVLRWFGWWFQGGLKKKSDELKVFLKVVVWVVA